MRRLLTFAFAGLIGVGISAAVALLTGQGEDNFLWGFTVNSVLVVVLVVSMLLRRPLVGIIAAVDVLVTRTRWGRHLLAVGSNAAARVLGKLRGGG